MLNVLVTGAEGFIGRNLCAKLSELGNINVFTLNRNSAKEELSFKVKESEIIFHLAGENRPENEEDYTKNNAHLTSLICDEIKVAKQVTGKKITLVYTSSIQAELDNPYGVSKRVAEEHIEKLQKETDINAVIYRLPGVFGKWSRPNYNSVVATFSYQIARNLSIKINNPSHRLKLIYIDDLIEGLINLIDDQGSQLRWGSISPEFEITVGELAEKLKRYHDQRKNMRVSTVGVGLDRALYATYLSFVPNDEFYYKIPGHSDDRGIFYEMLKTENSGQISFFKSRPGVIRGEHYHNTKSEKFLVIKGIARFIFKDIFSSETIEFIVDSDDATVVDTIPGWAHSIENICDEDLIVLLWANEVFDPKNPDTIHFR